MRKKTSKMISDGRENLEVEYILESRPACLEGCAYTAYDFAVICKNRHTGAVERAAIEDAEDNAERAEQLYHTIIEGEVLPVTLGDILEDYVAARSA